MIIGNADPFAALLWASFAGCAAAIALPCFQRILTPGQAMESWLGGMQSMLIAIVILVVAWGLGGITHELGTGTYMASLLTDNLTLPLFPGVDFLIAYSFFYSTAIYMV